MESPRVKVGLCLLVTLEMGELLVNRITGWYGMSSASRGREGIGMASFCHYV